MEWISVNDRLPENKTIIDIVMFNGKRETDVNFDPSREGISRFYKYKDLPHFPEIETIFLVSHWMPLPELPKINE